MPSLPFTLVSHARPASLLAIEAVLTVATRAAAAVVVKPASVAAELAAAACAAVAVHGVAAVAGSVADDVALPAAFSHHQSFVEAVVGGLAPVFVEVSADLAPAWRTSSPAVAGISDLP